MKTQLFRIAAAFAATAALTTSAAFAQSITDNRPPAPPPSAATRDMPAPAAAKAGPTIYITDTYGQLATFTLGTNAVHRIGSEGVVLTDLGFNPKDHQLYGISFTSFYRVNAATGRATYIGNLGVNDANALVFDASGNGYVEGVNNYELWSVNVKTGRLSGIGSTYPYRSAGDLTFYNGSLVLSGYDASGLGGETPDILVALNAKNGRVAGYAKLGIANLFGIVSTGTNLMYGFANTSVYQLEPWQKDINERAIRLYNFAGKGLGNINGAAYDGDFQT